MKRVMLVSVFYLISCVIVTYGSTCDQPASPYGSVIIYPSKQEEYENGSVVLHGCKQGFYLVGSPIIKCNGNKWTQIQFRCLGFCPDVRYILNGKVLRVTPKVGKAAIEFHCNKNFRLIGTPRMECINGRWQGKMPYCQKLQSCTRLRSPTNGTLHGTDINHGAEANFTCFTGFDLFGSTKLTCNNGVWSASVPTCKAYCVKIRDPPNGHVFGTRFSHGRVVSFKCNLGYELVGDRTLRCINGRWNSSAPQCKAMLCSKPSIPSNSYIIYPNKDSYTHGTIVFLACHDGYYLMGSPMMVCNQTAWIKREFSCVASCPAIGPVKNGVITSVTLMEGGEVEIDCHAHFTLVGSSKLRCINGKWNDSLPSCKAFCSDPGNPLPGRAIGDDFSHSKRVSFTCPRDYVMEGARTITCSDGQWSDNTPNCRAPCVQPVAPAHGRIEGRDFRHGQSVNFWCFYGYRRVGDSPITCNDGNWDKQFPVCKGICTTPRNPSKGKLHRKIPPGRFLDGDEATFSCNNGYDLFGNPKQKLRCVGKSWDSSVPECKARCLFIGRPDHGFYAKGQIARGGMIKHGEKITFGCLTSYTMVGANMQECDNGRWTNDRPTCKASCPRPGNIKQGKRFGKDFGHAKQVTYQCDVEYTLDGSSKLTCNDGTWNSNPPACRAPCRDPGSPPNGNKRVQDLRHNSWVAFSCDRNYELDGNKRIQCNDGVWSGNVPRCVALCKDPGKPAKGKRLNNNFQDGSTVTFKCNTDQDLIGNDTIRCEGGVWSGDVPICKARCSDPGAPENGAKEGDDYRSGASVTFRCNSPLELIGSHVILCQDGRWSNSRPSCSDCGMPLGLESKTNNAIRITSTTTNIGWNYGPSSARLNGPYAWCTRSFRGYLLINLGKTYKLTAIATQGGTLFNRWVKKYRISFKSGETTVHYKESGSIKDIEGNKDASTIAKYTFKEPFITDTIWIALPVDADNVCLRTELYGCDPTFGCILVGSMFWGIWAYNRKALNYWRA